MDSRKPEVPVLQSLFSFLRFDNRDKIEDKNFKILEWNGCIMKHLIIGSSIFIEIHWFSKTDLVQGNFETLIVRWRQTHPIQFLLVDQNLVLRWTQYSKVVPKFWSLLYHTVSWKTICFWFIWRINYAMILVTVIF